MSGTRYLKTSHLHSVRKGRLQSELVWDERKDQGFRLPGANFSKVGSTPLANHLNMFVFSSKGHDGASSRKAALLIPAACQSPGSGLLLGAAGGEVTSIKERAELLIKLFVSYSF